MNKRILLTTFISSTVSAFALYIGYFLGKRKVIKSIKTAGTLRAVYFKGYNDPELIVDFKNKEIMEGLQDKAYVVFETDVKHVILKEGHDA